MRALSSNVVAGLTEIGRMALRGAGGEPVDLARTVHAHGCTTLPPLSPSLDPVALEAVLTVPRGAPRRVRVAQAGSDAVVSVYGRRPAAVVSAHVMAQAHHMLRLEDDLSGFYALAAEDPQLAWVTAGAGRMAVSESPFEDLIKTLLTTNCAWSATVRMVTALVEALGEPAVGGGRAFPTAEAMAAMDEDFYRQVVRAGYRASSLRTIARLAAAGDLEVASWRSPELEDDEVERRLLALPGIGPYAAAHMMMLLGRHSRLILDSWTRPTYARLVGRTSVSDAAIAKRFRRYGDWRGLAFWLFLTRDWLDQDATPSASAKA